MLAGGGGVKIVSPLSSSGSNVGTGYQNYPPPLSRLLDSIAQKMGLDINVVGRKSTARGMSLQGPLDRLV